MEGGTTRLLVLATLLLAGHTEGVSDVLFAVVNPPGPINTMPYMVADVWSPDEKRWLNCSLPPLPEDLYQPAINLAGEKVMACWGRKCWLLGQSGWEEGPTTLWRSYHTSAVLPGGRILLVGGDQYPTTTEIVQANHPTVPGFTLNPPRWEHCSVQTGATTIVLTGGVRYYPVTDADADHRTDSTLVQEYSGIDQGRATSKNLPSLNQGRRDHACGGYTVGGRRVIIVAGGYYPHFGDDDNGIWGADNLDSTETLELSVPGAKWNIRSGKLPSPLTRHPLGLTLGSTFYLAGWPDMLAWTEANDDWTKEGKGRETHVYGVASVPSTVVAKWCG